MNINSSLLNEWAEAVREAYIVNDILPNEMVQEIAEANDLNIEQVKRLCESSNLAIKRSLKKGKVDDVSFPLASFQTVLDNMQPEAEVTEVKEACFVQNTPLKEFCKYYLTRHSRMTKQAAVPELTEEMLADMAEHARQQHMKARREVTLQKCATEKIASRIMSYLADEMRKKSNVNESYSAVRELVTPELVDNMYKLAHSLLVEDLAYDYVEPQLIKLGGRIPNPDSEIIGLFNLYEKAMEKLAELEKAEKQLIDVRVDVDGKLRQFLVGAE